MSEGGPSKLRLRFETVGSIAAIVVGVAALFVSWDQARVMRAQQHASVLPAIQIDGYWGEYEDGARFGVRVSNNGVGPAVIRHVGLSRDGETMRDGSVLAQMFPDGADFSWSSMNGRILAAGSIVEPFSVSLPDGVSEAEGSALVADWVRWDMDICYCSVFDRCWITSTDGGVDRRRPSGGTCPDAGEDIFEQLGLPARD